MTIDTNAIVTATEANQNFSRVAKLAEKKGRVVVFKNNRPKKSAWFGYTQYQIFNSKQ